MDEVITTGKNQIQGEIKDKIMARLEKEDIGLQMVNITIQDAEPPTAEVLAAFKEVETAKQSADTAVNNANKYRSEQIPAAEAEADQILQNAQAQKEARINEAMGQVARFNSMYQEYARYPLITKQRMYYETMEEGPARSAGHHSGRQRQHGQPHHRPAGCGHQPVAGEGGEGMKKIGKLLTGLAAAAVLAVVVLANSVVITRQNEYTVVRQFGEVVGVRDTPGVSFKIPFVQSTATLPNTVLLYDLPISDVITQDKKTMVADSFALWKIADPVLFIQTLNGSVSNAESRLSTIVYNSMKNIISSRTQTDVISGRDGELAADIRDGVGDTLDQYGIQLIAVETKHLDLPTTTRKRSTSG